MVEFLRPSVVCLRGDFLALHTLLVLHILPSLPVASCPDGRPQYASRRSSGRDIQFRISDSSRICGDNTGLPFENFLLFTV